MGSSSSPIELEILTAIEECPNCGLAINGPKNRLVQEVCGHNKCRQCFLDEENGCKQCDIRDQLEVNLNHPHAQRVLVIKQPPSTPCKIKSEWAKLSTNEEKPERWSPAESYDEAEVTHEEVLWEDDILIEKICPEDSPRRPPEISEVIVVEKHFVVTEGNHLVLANESEVLPRDCVIKTNVNNEGKSHKTPLKAKSTSKKGPADAQVNRCSSLVTLDQVPDHMELLPDGKYRCRICNKDLQRMKTIRYHFYCDPKIPKPYPCEECGKSFCTADHLKYHKEAKHVGSGGGEGGSAKGQPCSICGKMFQNKFTLAAHHKRNHSTIAAPFKCHDCGDEFHQQSKYRLHRQIHDKVLPFTCTKCPKAFRLKENLTKHMIVHSDAKPFVCDYCGTQFKRKVAWKQHIKKHGDDYRPEFGPCDKCGKNFTHLTALKRHVATHSMEVNEFACPKCDVKCTRKDNLTRHMKSMHADELDVVEDVIIDEIKEAEEEVVEINEEPKGEKQAMEIVNKRQDSVIIFVGHQKQPRVEERKEEVDGSKGTNQAMVAQASVNTRPGPTKSFNNFPRIMSNDHLEIYRKILLPSRDDEEMSAIEQDEFVHWYKRPTTEIKAREEHVNDDCPLVNE